MTALGKLEDVCILAQKLRECLPKASRGRERAKDVAEVCRVYKRTLLRYLEGASTMTTKQREIIHQLNRQVENTERLLLSLNNGSDTIKADLTDLERAHASAVKVEQYLEEFTVARGASEMFSVSLSDLDSICSLASLLLQGAKGVMTDPAKALALYSRAADGGHVESMIHLAKLLEDGANGVGTDRVRAAGLYAHVIEKQANAEAMKRLAFLLERITDGGDAGHAAAVKRYSRAVLGERVSDAVSQLA